MVGWEGGGVGLKLNSSRLAIHFKEPRGEGNKLSVDFLEFFRPLVSTGLGYPPIQDFEDFVQ